MIKYVKADISYLDELVKIRTEVLRSANNLDSDVDMSEVESETEKYYQEYFETDDNVTYLVYDDDKIIGTGSVSFFKVMPTYHNPSGKKAYIMNMYTNPEYRRQGIAYKTLDLLVNDSKNRGIKNIFLEATEMGRKLYIKYGFVQMNNEMEYIENK